MTTNNIVSTFGKSQLNEYEASVRYSKNDRHSKIVFNKKISSEIVSKQFNKCYVYKNSSDNKVFLVFNNTSGYTVKANKTQNKVSVSSSIMIGRTIRYFDLKEFGNYRLHVSKNVANTDSCSTIQVFNVYELSQLKGKETKETILKAGNLDSEASQPDLIQFEDSKPSKKTEKASKPASVSQKPTIQDSILVLKAAGYRVLAPQTHYVEV